MSTEIIIITQKHVGTALVKAAKNIYGKLPLPITAVAVNYRTNPDQLLTKLDKLLGKFPEEDDILVLTDLYGSTPSNIANQLCKRCHHRTKLITGLNLPMLVKILNYPDLSLDKLAEKAVSGGQQGVFDCSCLQ